MVPSAGERVWGHRCVRKSIAERLSALRALFTTPGLYLQDAAIKKLTAISRLEERDGVLAPEVGLLPELDLGGGPLGEAVRAACRQDGRWNQGVGDPAGRLGSGLDDRRRRHDGVDRSRGCGFAEHGRGQYGQRG